MRIAAGLILFAAGLLAPLICRAAEPIAPLVDAAWVKNNFGRPSLVFLDLRSAAGRSKDDYLKGHIPGAVFTDYTKDGWREKSKEGIEGQLPPPEKLELLIGGLGIDNTMHVVLVPYGISAAEMGAATRLYWTFKVLGHDAVSILDGGFLAYAVATDTTARGLLERGDAQRPVKVFKARLRADMVATAAEVQAAIGGHSALIDNRPPDHFIGISKSAAVKRFGTLPGAKNVPESWLTENNGGRFRKKEQLSQIYQTAGVPATGKQITFCSTGHWASLGWFVSSEILGNREAKMYPGSMAEWTADASRPMEQRVK